MDKYLETVKLKVKIINYYMGRYNLCSQKQRSYDIINQNDATKLYQKNIKYTSSVSP